MFDELRKAYPEAAEEDTMPSDFVKNRKHYVYGFPKEDEE